MTYQSEYLLVELLDCKSYLGVDDPDDNEKIGYLMQSVSQMFKAETNRSLLQEELTEYYDGRDTDTIMLRSTPLSSTHETISVYLDNDRDFTESSKLASTSLFVDQEIGAVHYDGGIFDRGRRNVKVIYTAGWTRANMPHDIRVAALEALGVLWKRMSEKRFDTSTVSRGDVSYSYLEAMPHTVVNTLARYRSYA